MQVGGTELNALRTVEQLDRSRFDVTIISLQPDGPLAERYRVGGIRVVPFRLTSLYAFGSVQQGWRLAAWLRRERIDILHCHDLYSNIFGAPCGRAARLRAVITSRRWLHPARNRQLEIANRAAYRLGHWVLVNSAAVAAAVTSTDRVAAERVLIVPNFVDASAFDDVAEATKAQLWAEIGIPTGAEVVGCIARLAPVKDHATLITAIRILAERRPRLHLVLVGDGESRAALERLAEESGIGARVHFAGYRPQRPNLNRLFDISTLASVSEGFPNSIVEAMAAARPVVATRVGGNCDAVRSHTGVLVGVGDAAGFADAFDRLLAARTLMDRMGSAAQEVAAAEYHAAAVIPHLEAIYTRLAGVQA
ncbi:MAG TPA: glycosyltransferase [Gemmatimonadaceae bacterium]|nr:glycosyltransferase [Gemmatimonadaceae bacterium]